MFWKNDVQKNFKRQMKELEKDLKQKEKAESGAFTNSFYKERFYGYTDSNSKRVVFNRIIRFVFTPIGMSILFVVFLAISSLYGNTENNMFSAYENGKFEESIKYSDKILAREPDNYNALAIKGSSFAYLDQFDEAFETLKKAETFGSDSDLYYELGYTCYELQRYDEAVEYLDKAIDLDSEYLDAYIFKGYSLAELQKYDEADKCADVLEALDKNNAYACNIRGLTKVYTGNYEEGIKNFDKAIALYSAKGKFEAAYINKAWALYSQKNYSDCLDYCNSVKADLPESYDIAYYAGDCYSILGEHDKAISAYEEAFKLEPDDTSLLTNIGWEYYILEEYEKAKDYVKKAQDIYSEDYMAKTLDEYINEAMKPEAERIVNFVRNNYLYLDKVTNFEQMAQKFIEKKDVDLPDIYEFLESVRLKDDLYTFFIFDEYYKQMLLEEESNKIEHKALADNIQYIKINSFTSGIDEQFRSIVNKIPEPKEQILVIDLRDNPGGLADTANNMLDTLLPECVTSYLIDRSGEIYSYSSDKNNTDFKHIYIYVNEESASSSEILALGLKTYLNNVTIIGRPTVGKGVCQTVFENKKESYMIFLVECYWNIKEKNVSDKKIQPDIKIKGNDLKDYIDAMNGHISNLQ